MKQLFAFLIAAPILALAAIPTAYAHTEPTAQPSGTDNDFLGIQTVRLWPGEGRRLRHAKGRTVQGHAHSHHLRPRVGAGNGSAVIIFPGGGYVAGRRLEGREVADWFTARGFRAFVLSYRPRSHGYLLPVPLLDARRAIQTVRARARDYHINPNRIVIIGFSAGGHLAALAATHLCPAIPTPTTRSTASPAGPTIWSSATPGSAPSLATPRT